jgi:hypothetical protein
MFWSITASCPATSLLRLRGRRCHRDSHLIDRACEFVVAFFVVFAHQRAEVLANVIGFIRREDERLSALDSAVGNLLPMAPP